MFILRRSIATWMRDVLAVGITATLVSQFMHATTWRGRARRHESRRTMGWVGFGVALLLLMGIVLGRWVAGGVRSVDPGGDAFGGIDLVVLRMAEWAQFGVFLVLVFAYVISPAFRGRALGFDGAFIVVSFLMNFWDPLDNYWTFAFQYNAHFVNVGAWGGYLPGWHSPGADAWAVPVAFIFGCYTWSWFAAVRLGSWLLHLIRDRRPTLPAWCGFAVVYVAMAVQAGLSEVVFLRLQHWTYPTTFNPLTAWDGQTYAFPLFNPAIYGLTWVVCVWLRESAEGSGFSYPERGIPSMTTSPAIQSAMRILILTGFVSVAYILTYFVPFNLLVAHGELHMDLPSFFPLP